MYCGAISKYDSIGFRPHVTLCPSFRCADRSQASKIATSISKRLKGFKIELEGLEIAHSDAFFQICIYKDQVDGFVDEATAIARAEIHSTLSSGYPRKTKLSIHTFPLRTETGQKRNANELPLKYAKLHYKSIKPLRQI